MPAPKIGEIKNGYRYGGGDPYSKDSWSWVDPAVSSGPASTAYNPASPGASYFSPQAIAPTLPQEDRKFVAKIREGRESANALRADAKRFVDLNEKRRTGGIQMKNPLLRGFVGMFDPGVGEMEAISEKITPQMREAGSGAMSDADVAMYRKSTVGVDKLGLANRAIQSVIDAGAKRQGDYLAFMEEWGRQKKNLTGAQEAWEDYASANPLYDNKDGKNTTVRKTTPWRDWFGLPGARGIPPEGQRGNPVTIPNPAALSTLPPGAFYKYRDDPKGVTYQWNPRVTPKGPPGQPVPVGKGWKLLKVE